MRTSNQKIADARPVLEDVRRKISDFNTWKNAQVEQLTKEREQAVLDRDAAAAILENGLSDLPAFTEAQERHEKAQRTIQAADTRLAALENLHSSTGRSDGAELLAALKREGCLAVLPLMREYVTVYQHLYALSKEMAELQSAYVSAGQVFADMVWHNARSGEVHTLGSFVPREFVELYSRFNLPALYFVLGGTVGDGRYLEHSDALSPKLESGIASVEVEAENPHTLLLTLGGASA